MAAVFLLGEVSLLRAGTIITLTNGSEDDGKLSVIRNAVHVESQSATPDSALNDVLEANFGDAPFQLNFFSVGKGDALPADWTAQEIGPAETPGSAAIHDGIVTLNDSGNETGEKLSNPKNQGARDNLFFAGRPWADSGQFTARLAGLDSKSPLSTAGLIMKQTLDPGSAMFATEVTGYGSIRMPIRQGAFSGSGQVPADLPLWLRFTRFNNEIYSSISSDGNDWNIIAESAFKSLVNPLVGLFVDSHRDKHAGRALFDHVSVTPLPSSAQILPPGVVLQGGTLLAGHFAFLNFDPSSASGDFLRGDKKITISHSLIAAVITLPMERSRLAELAAKPGILMKNGDMMDGDLTSISNAGVAVSSVLLGITNYTSVDVRACFVQPLQVQPAAYEVRLKDGSIINASAIAGDASELVITDVSGLTLQAAQSEVAQIRAGTSQVQELAQLNWVATPPAPGGTPPQTNGADLAANAAPSANPVDPSAANMAAPAGNPAPSAAPAELPVQSWLGTNQEQILEAGMDTAIEFPLTGKFRALGTQVALASSSPPNSTMTISILADGKEIAKSPTFRAGEPPRFLEITFQNPAHVTLRAESMFPGARVLYIDPVAIRNQP